MQRYDDEFDWTQRAREKFGRHAKASRICSNMLLVAIFYVGFCAGIVACAIVHEVMK